MLNALCDIGGVFAELDDFVSQRGDGDRDGEGGGAPRELYLHAVRVGIDLRLQQYRVCIPLSHGESNCFASISTYR